MRISDWSSDVCSADLLLAEQVGLALFLEGGLDGAGPAAADRRRVAQRDLQGVARRVLVERHQAGDAAAAQVFRAHGLDRALRRAHEDVDVVARLDEVAVDVEALRYGEGGALAACQAEVLGVN